MGFTRTVSIGTLALVAVAAAGVYAPEAVDRFAPALGPVMHRTHDRILGGQKQANAGQAEGSRSGAAPGGVAPIAVTVTPARRADFPVILESLGQVQAYNTVLVRARVDGEIVRIGFKEGQIVQKGDLLAQIDPRPFQAALDQAVAKKSQDEATVANARLDLTRYATLAKQNFATQQQLDTQNALVNQLTATIAADAAAVDAARVQLDYTTIRAPITGRAGFRLIDEGNLVNAGQQTGIVSIAQLQPIAVIFTEPQAYVDRINQELASGAPDVTVLNTDGARIAVGKLTISDNQVDPATGTIRLKAEFDNKDDALWPGLAVTTQLRLGVMKNVVVVAADAVQHSDKGLFVYVVGDDGRASVRRVKVARQDPTTAVIAEGLNEGDRVVTTGEFLLQPGSLVSVDAGSGS
ncbi:multidrug efflux system membrane fusion protein [Roseiarcus fermentans]|uniref:Multidrug efflux system membrane fusion protein n=1 Tax=Roseiarcus fermentans TaxID=1473586 RepID=A0A366FR97_9HYPH|nr:efflux RND transporter periplasmic adaptor subunit [Roseiarcus fermentans]RBP17138.1 multidrug efflux system membrane fusion protein [Roseiarcus fermentans]